jgi:glycine/D-amino acid oxidase-like deaminating enzyme
MANDSNVLPPRPSSTAPVASDKPDVARRDFLKVAGAGAGLLLLGGAGATAAADVPGLVHKRRSPFFGGSSADVVVVGGGAWGGWTSLYLRQMGAKVTMVDAYGPGNSRSTSGDESRGVRSSYGDRAESPELWMLWARESMNRWKQFDAEWGRDLRLNLFHTTGDLILRPDWEPYLVKTKHWWDKHKIPYDVLNPDDVRKAFPVISMDDITAVLYEPDAGVVRARRACQTVAAVAEYKGVKIVIGRARTSKITNGRLEEIVLDTGQTIRGETFVFAPGPWLGKTFPELFANKMRTPLGYVCYFGTPPSDERFTYPNLPSYNFPGVTGWAALPVDSRGFRVRGGERAPGTGQAGAAAGRGGRGGQAGAANGRAGTGGRGGGRGRGGAGGRGGATQQVAAGGGRGGAAAGGRGGGFGGNAANTPPQQLDPDTSDRWADAPRIEGPRRFVTHRFPLLKDAPILQTHSCHYELSSSRNFIVDHHPAMSNVLIAGGGNAEGFKFGPTIGEYIAQRALGDVGDPAVAKAFKIPEHDFEVVPPPAADTGGRGRGARPTPVARGGRGSGD